MKVVLAYSGGLDTSVAARSLREDRGLHVVACFVDLGQPFDLDEVRARAEAAHADLVVVDARERFAEEFCVPAIHANALYEGRYPLVSALARPLIAEEVVRVAREAGAELLGHGCTGKGNDQVRFETSFAALAPELGVVAPVRETSRSREESLALAERWGIPQAAEASTYSVDENLWGRTIEAGPLEDPWAEPPPNAFAITAGPRAAPDEPAEVVVGFEAGRPVALDGRRLGPAELVDELGRVAGAHGFGRVDMIENRLVGIKSREVYEVPAALALLVAHRDLEDLTLERSLAHEKAGLERRWAELCYDGQWHGPLHASLRDFMAGTQERVTGDVRLRFFKSSCVVVGRRSDRALYRHDLATYEGAADRFDQGAAEGFIRLWSLPIRVWNEAARPPRSRPLETASPALSEEEEAATRSSAPAREAAPPAVQGRALHGTVWGGRFAQPPAPDAAAFTGSLGFDRRLLVPDLLATKAHAGALHDAGILEAEQRDAIVAEVDRLLEDPDGFPFGDDEDVHAAVERVLTERLGPAGAAIHAGRSRNDLVATDLRLWTRDAAASLAMRVRGLAAALADRAEEHVETLLAGTTHLQRAQPVTLAHHLLAHAFPLARDAARLDAAGASASSSSPLGAGALATSTLGLDPARTAETLGFDGAFENSIDAVSDRDFALELLFACLTTALHVSRLAEDLVLWCGAEHGFATPADAYATGSSMMPQKRNPDVAELARAKAGRVLGDLVALATVLKGLPLAYARDLQEDKEAVFDAHDALGAALDAMAGMVRTLTFHPERMTAAASDPSLGATDLAEHLVLRGVPFREAHRTVGELVAELEAAGRTLADLDADEWKARGFGAEAAELLDPRGMLARRGGPGGPAPAAVRAQLIRLRRGL